MFWNFLSSFDVTTSIHQFIINYGLKFWQCLKKQNTNDWRDRQELTGTGMEEQSSHFNKLIKDSRKEKFKDQTDDKNLVDSSLFKH